jgi:hypothetical protein
VARCASERRRDDRDEGGSDVPLSIRMTWKPF